MLVFKIEFTNKAIFFYSFVGGLVLLLVLLWLLSCCLLVCISVLLCGGGIAFLLYCVVNFSSAEPTHSLPDNKQMH